MSEETRSKVSSRVEGSGAFNAWAELSYADRIEAVGEDPSLTDTIIGYARELEKRVEEAERFRLERDDAMKALETIGDQRDAAREALNRSQKE